MNFRLVRRFLKYHLPWLNRRSTDAPHPPNVNPRYCYGVWLRHLSVLRRHCPDQNLETVAEFGPGDSIGAGLMALLTGSKTYYALDVVDRTCLKQNTGLLDELVTLLSNREDIPGETEFPRVNPRLASYAFPSKLLTDAERGCNLDKDWICRIKEALLNATNLTEGSPSIQYICPWYDSKAIPRESVDMMFSQAVMQYVHDLDMAYATMHRWLKPDGLMSHQIDFKAHDTAVEWNGHWACSDFEWKLITGKKLYAINRAPLSTHIDLLEKIGFKILSIIPVKTYPRDKYTGSIPRDRLASRFKHMTEDDFTTCSAYILSVKK